MAQDRRLLELDALRGLAAMFVVLFHFTMGRPQAGLGFNLGLTGVDLFFIISGFVIFMTISKVSTTREFLVGRAARLYPAYWFCVTFTFFLICFTKNIYHNEPGITTDLLWQYLINLTMIQQLLGVEHLDGPYWTLTIELLFYAFVAIIYRMKGIPHFLVIGSLFLLLILCYQAILKFQWPWGYGVLHGRFPLVNHFPLFFAGTIFYTIYLNQKIRFRAGLYALLGLCLIVQASLFDKAGRAQHITPSQYFWMLLLFFILFSLFVHRKLGFIVCKPTVFLGAISYPLYLVHQFLGVSIILPGLIKVLGISYWISVSIALVVVLLIATFVTYTIEAPGRRLIRKAFA